MLPGVAPPGRAPPGRGGIPPGPGRGPPGPAGPCGLGMARSTEGAEENGLLPTRGGRGAPGLGPAGAGAAGRGPGAAGAAGAVGAVAAGAAGAGAAGAAGAGAGAAGTGAAGTGAAGASAGAAAALAAAFFAGAFAGAASAAGFAPPNDSRRRRATGASTVDEADLTNSPCSLRRARTSLLVTPSSFANSCTRALPVATTSPSLEAAAGRPRLGFSYDAWSSGLHGVLMFFATCFSKWSTTGAVSGEPVIRSARANARRRMAAVRQLSSGCNHAPRPGRRRCVSTVTADWPFSVDTATTRSSSTANSRFRHPMQVRTGAPGTSRWITAQSTSPRGLAEPTSSGA